MAIVLDKARFFPETRANQAFVLSAGYIIRPGPAAATREQELHLNKKLSAFAAATVLLAATLPSAAQAQTAQDDDMSYPRLTHCAALNVMLGQVLGAGEDRDKPEVKAQAQTFIAQAAALTMVAAAMNQTDPKKVQEDVFAQNEAMAQSFTREGAAQELMQRDLGPCNELGKAAYDAVENADKG